MMILTWKYVKPLQDEKLISEYEKSSGYTFPDDYKQCVRQYNGGRPILNQFDTDDSRGRMIKSLLSFNQNDAETIWKITEWNQEELQEHFIPIATDPSGCLICFDKNDSSVNWINLENMKTERIADNFEAFLYALY